MELSIHSDRWMFSCKNEKRRVRGEGCYAGKDPADEGIVR